MQNEQYPMPAMTEQERQEAIEHIKGVLREYDEHGGIGYGELAYRSALAALTAEPVATRCRYRDSINTWLYVPQDNYSPDTTGTYQEQPLYAAPPVQVLRPVELKDCDFAAVSHMSGGTEDYCYGFVDGTQNAIKSILAAGYEVKE